MSALRIARLSRSFGGVRAVDDVSFALEPGSITALIGPNGAGKSTLVNLIDGQLAPDAGTIEFEGHTLVGVPTVQRTRAGIGRTFQVAQTFASMTVLQNAQLARVAAAGATLSPAAPLMQREVDAALQLLQQVGLFYAVVYFGQRDGCYREVLRAMTFDSLQQWLMTAHPIADYIGIEQIHCCPC